MSISHMYFFFRVINKVVTSISLKEMLWLLMKLTSVQLASSSCRLVIIILVEVSWPVKVFFHANWDGWCVGNLCSGISSTMGLGLIMAWSSFILSYLTVLPVDNSVTCKAIVNSTELIGDSWDIFPCRSD